MKYIVVLGDGMADYTLAELGNKTPLEVAFKPTVDTLAKHGQLGLVKTVPDGMHPGSDTANLAVLGYDPQLYYSGRSPFEAASIGVELAPDDITFRCNLVTLTEEPEYEHRIILDHSADEISTAEAQELLYEVTRHFANDELSFYTGVSYRHLLVWHHAPSEWSLTPPHDILDKQIGAYLPQGPHKEKIRSMMKESSRFLAEHPVNKKRIRKGLRPANSIWIWGEGRKPALLPFAKKYGLQGAVISAVDLIKGIGICAGLHVIEVEGATGNLDTNYEGKARAALNALRQGCDFVYIHIEAPDECGHRQERDNKIKAIEYIDTRLVKILTEELTSSGEPFRLLFLPDHATPLALRTHTADPVPFLIYDSTKKPFLPAQTYDEKSARNSGFFIEEGFRLMDIFLTDITGGSQS